MSAATAEHDVTEPLDPDLRDVLRRALGLDYQRTPYKNFVALHADREGIRHAWSCERFGYLVEDRAAHYGKMRVFRVTKSGFAALEIPRPKPSLVALATNAAETSLAADNLSFGWTD